MLRRVVALGSALSCVVFGGACRNATQIEAHITTDVPCATVRERHTSLFSGNPATEAPYASTGDCRDAAPTNDIGTIVLAPSDDTDVPLDVSFVLGVNARSEDCVTHDYVGCIRARRRIRFVPHEGLRMPVELSLQCLDKVCDPNQTCFRGACIALDVIAQNGCLGPECSAPPPAANVSVEDTVVGPDPERVVPATSMPYGLALDGDEVWWSQQGIQDASGRSSITTYNVVTQSQTARTIAGRVFGIALSSTFVFYATYNTNTSCGGFANRLGAGGAGNVSCADGSEYVGAGVIGTGDLALAGSTFLYVTNTKRVPTPTPAGYVEVAGTTVSYATLGGIGFWDSDTTVVTHRKVGTDAASMRGHAIAPNHWFVSSPRSAIYAMAKANGNAVRVVSSGKFSKMEDIAWHEPTKTLYVAGETVAQGFGVYRLTNLDASLPK